MSFVLLALPRYKSFHETMEMGKELESFHLKVVPMCFGKTSLEKHLASLWLVSQSMSVLTRAF